MDNGSKSSALVEFCKIGLMHSPSGRLLTSEVFRGELNVSGTALKRKTVWSLLLNPASLSTVLIKNHMGRYLSADKDGNVALTTEWPERDECFVMTFNPTGSGEVSIRSDAHGNYLEADTHGVRCFNKKPVWWGLRLAIHPQVHMKSLHRSCYLQVDDKTGELKADLKVPVGRNALIWLEQPLLPASNARFGTGEQLTADAVARLSRVALRTYTGQYLNEYGCLEKTITDRSLFAISFKPDVVPVITLQSLNGGFLTVGAGGALKVKQGIVQARREEHFTFEGASNHVHLFAHNNKFATTRQGLAFTATEDEALCEEASVFLLEHLGGVGLKVDDLLGQISVPSAEVASSPPPIDGSLWTPQTVCLPTGHWRLRTLKGEVWEFPPNGNARLSADEGSESSKFEMLALTSTEAGQGDDARAGVGGFLVRTLEGQVASARRLGAVACSGQREPVPRAEEVFRLLPLINRPYLAVFSPISWGFLAPTAASQRADASSSNPSPVHLRRLSSGACHLLSNDGVETSILTVKPDGVPTFVKTTSSPQEGVPLEGTEFVFIFVSPVHVLIRLVSGGAREVALLCADTKGSVTVETSGIISPGCLWQI